MMEEMFQEEVLPNIGFYVLWGIMVIVGVLLLRYAINQSEFLAGKGKKETDPPRRFSAL